jgi:hypothetical protein
MRLEISQIQGNLSKFNRKHTLKFWQQKPSNARETETLNK